MFFERRMMMRKLLILTVVLGMASYASATLVFTDTSDVSGDATLSLTISAADSTEYPWYLVVADNAVGTIGPGTEGIGNLTDDKTTYYPTYYMNVALVAAGLNPANVSSAYGVIADSGGGALSGIGISDIAFGFLGTGTIDLYTSPTGDTGTWGIESTINVVPEPMTMALLGLGGLFLRRRK
jgi:hypothetical protein